jgi:hypothetical protein
MAVITPIPKTQFIGANGAPLVGGKVYTYQAGTTSPQVTYTDSTGSSANTNPIILDSRGEANIWLGEATYKFKLTDANDVEIWTVDYISAPTTAVSPVLTGNVTISTDSSGPALKITQTGTGDVLRVQDSVDPDLTPFVINAAGLVGLGTVAPAEALDIDNNGRIQFSANGTPRTVISADATNSTVDVRDARNLVLRVNGGNRLTIASTGMTSLANGLTVSASGAAITGNSSVTGTFTSSGALTVSSGGATISAGGLTVSAGGAAITGNSSVTGTLGVSSTLTASNGLTVSAGGAAITGNSSVTGTLGVSSTLTASNGLTVSAGGAAITGNSSVTGTLGVSSTLTASNGLTVSAGGAGITGTLTANSGVSVPSGGVNVTGTVTATTFSGAWANIPAGTVMLFVQTSAPTGWTKSTAHNDKALRVVSGSASSGGSVAFTTAFASQAVTGTVASYTLTTADIPSHNHSATSTSTSTSSVTDSGHTHNYDRSGSNTGVYQPGAVGATGSLNYTATATTSATTGISVSTSTSTSTTIGNTGGGGGHSHGFSAPNINLAVQYVDVIIATKD